MEKSRYIISHLHFHQGSRDSVLQLPLSSSLPLSSLPKAIVQGVCNSDLPRFFISVRMAAIIHSPSASTSGRVRLCLRPCPPQRQAMVLDDPRGVKGNIRLFRPIHLHLLLDDPRGVKGKTVVSFSASKGVIVFWTAKFFSHCLPHLLRESPYFLHISFAISLSPSHLLHHLLQFIRLSVRLLSLF